MESNIYFIANPSALKSNIRKIQVSDPVHADIMNNVFGDLVDNDAFMVRMLEKMAGMSISQLADESTVFETVMDIQAEVNGKLGNIGSLTTVSKNIVGAINELVTVVSNLTSGDVGGGSGGSNIVVTGGGDLETRRMLSLLYATKEIEGQVEGYTGVFFDLFNDLYNGSTALMDKTKAKSIFSIRAGSRAIDILYFEEGMKFKIGDEVTIYDDVNLERRKIMTVADGRIMLDSPLFYNFKINTNIARSMATIDTVNNELKFGTWDYILTEFK